MSLIEPNDNLAEEYYKNAEETLRVTNLIRNSGSNMWLATQKYYAEYLSAYALLMKTGVKSEMHSCTIEVIKLMEEEGIIDFEFAKLLEEDKELRIDNQYYLKNKPIVFNPKQLSATLLEIRSVLDTITKEQISSIRKIIKNA